MMAKVRSNHSRKIVRLLVIGVMAVSALLAVTRAFAEPMDLGKIPKDVVQGWCGAHNGQFLDWGGAGVTCTTDTGGAMLCDKDSNCKGYPPKQTARQSGFSFPKPVAPGGRPSVTKR